MLKSKSLTNLIYEKNNKPTYYNIKLQKPDEKTFFSSIPATTPILIQENIIEKTNKSIGSYSEFLHKNPSATKEAICRFIVSLRLFSRVYEGKYVYFMKIY